MIDKNAQTIVDFELPGYLILNPPQEAANPNSKRKKVTFNLL